MTNENKYSELYKQEDYEIGISFEKGNVICLGNEFDKKHSVYVSRDYIETFSRRLYSDLDFCEIYVIDEEEYISVTCFNQKATYFSSTDTFVKNRFKKLKEVIIEATQYAQSEPKNRKIIRKLIVERVGNKIISETISIDSRNFKSSQKNELWELSGGYCEICGIKLTPFKGHHNSFEADHINAYSKGGITSTLNGQALCRSCNRKKSNN